MWTWLGRKTSECRRIEERLFALLETQPFSSLESWLAAAEPEVRAHVKDCARCSAEMDDVIYALSLLRANRPATADPGPAFAARVMQAIAEREQHGSSPGSLWFAVPAVAARLAWVSAAVLLVASTWMYEQRPSAPAPSAAKNVSADVFLEPAPPPATQDEILVSLAEREP